MLAKDLREGDVLTLADGTTATITKTYGEQLDEPVIVYNFEVKDFHTYYVTDTGVLVHNDDKCNLNIISENMEERVPNDEIEPPTERGRAPISKEDGYPIEIHHDEQNPDGPFREKIRTDHRLGDNYKKNHPHYGDKSKVDRSNFNRQRKKYWENEWDSGRWNQDE